jgi:hypothetical protein
LFRFIFASTGIVKAFLSEELFKDKAKINDRCNHGNLTAIERKKSRITSASFGDKSEFMATKNTFYFSFGLTDEIL